MNRPSKTTPTTGPRTGRKSADAPRARHGVRGGTGDANRMAVVILEVLAGARSPAEAAEALKISLPRYYILERRALEGMVAACEPKPVGKQPSPETRLVALEKELAQARRECARQQALVRAAQRSIGLPPADTTKASTRRDRRGRKGRRPAVRALKAAETLRGRLAMPEPTAVEHTPVGNPASADASIVVATPVEAGP